MIGVLLLVAGLGCLGWVAWQYFGTNVTSEKAFHEETSQLRDKWSQPTEEPAGAQQHQQSHNSRRVHDWVSRP